MEVHSDKHPKAMASTCETYEHKSVGPIIQNQMLHLSPDSKYVCTASSKHIVLMKINTSFLSTVPVPNYFNTDFLIDINTTHGAQLVNRLIPFREFVKFLTMEEINRLVCDVRMPTEPFFSDNFDEKKLMWCLSSFQSQESLLGALNSLGFLEVLSCHSSGISRILNINTLWYSHCCTNYFKKYPIPRTHSKIAHVFRNFCSVMYIDSFVWLPSDVLNCRLDTETRESNSLLFAENDKEVERRLRCSFLVCYHRLGILTVWRIEEKKMLTVNGSSPKGTSQKANTKKSPQKRTAGWDRSNNNSHPRMFDYSGTLVKTITDYCPEPFNIKKLFENEIPTGVRVLNIEFVRLGETKRCISVSRNNGTIELLDLDLSDVEMGEIERSEKSNGDSEENANLASENALNLDDSNATDKESSHNILEKEFSHSMEIEETVNNNCDKSNGSNENIPSEASINCEIVNTLNEEIVGKVKTVNENIGDKVNMSNEEIIEVNTSNEEIVNKVNGETTNGHMNNGEEPNTSNKTVKTYSRKRKIAHRYEQEVEMKKLKQVKELVENVQVRQVEDSSKTVRHSEDSTNSSDALNEVNDSAKTIPVNEMNDTAKTIHQVNDVIDPAKTIHTVNEMNDTAKTIHPVNKFNDAAKTIHDKTDIISTRTFVPTKHDVYSKPDSMLVANLLITYSNEETLIVFTKLSLIFCVVLDARGSVVETFYTRVKTRNITAMVKFSKDKYLVGTFENKIFVVSITRRVEGCGRASGESSQTVGDGVERLQNGGVAGECAGGGGELRNVEKQSEKTISGNPNKPETCSVLRGDDRIVVRKCFDLSNATHTLNGIANSSNTYLTLLSFRIKVKYESYFLSSRSPCFVSLTSFRNLNKMMNSQIPFTPTFIYKLIDMFKFVSLNKVSLATLNSLCLNVQDERVKYFLLKLFRSQNGDGKSSSHISQTLLQLESVIFLKHIKRCVRRASFDKSVMILFREWMRRAFPADKYDYRKLMACFPTDEYEERCAVCSEPVPSVENAKYAVCSNQHRVMRCSLSLVQCVGSFVQCEFCMSYAHKRYGGDDRHRCVFCDAVFPL